ncbi:response regulator [Spirosoma fluminis]
MKDDIRILLIEDDQDDVDLFRYALSSNAMSCKLDVVMEGDLVAPYLQTCAHLPDVIVMDLNLPRVHGREVLQLIKSTDVFRTIPLVVLTTSSALDDQLYSLKLGANHFITKPTTIHGFGAAITAITSLAIAQ